MVSPRKLTGDPGDLTKLAEAVDPVYARQPIHVIAPDNVRPLGTTALCSRYGRKSTRDSKESPQGSLNGAGWGRKVS